MQIGEYEIYAVETGRFRLDGGAMFGVVPKVLWERTNPADEANRIELALRVLVLKSAERIILVDTGVGEKNNEKFQKIYAIDQSRYNLRQGLAEIGLSFNDITDVILTHLHFDHTGGTTKDENGNVVPTFPNATYHVQEEHWDWAMHPAEKDRASFLKENFEPIESAGQLNKLEGPLELFSGVEILVMYGHTQGMQVVKVSDGRTTLLYCADLIPTASHIPIPYVMAYDNNPLITIEEKKRILPQAVRENWILFFEHDPYRAAATVVETEKGFRMGKEVEL